LSGVLVGIVNGFLFVPIYLEYFSEDAYGAWLASAGILLTIAIIDPGVGIVTTQRLSKIFGAGEDDKYAVETGTSLVLGFALAVVFCLCCLPLIIYGPIWFGCPAKFQRGMSVGLLFLATATGLNVFKHCIASIPYSLQRPMWPGFALVTAQISGLIGTYYFLTTGWGIVSLGIGQLITAAGLVGFYVVYVTRLWKSYSYARPTFCMSTAKEYVKTSGYMLASRLSNIAGSKLDAPIAALAVSSYGAVVFNQTSKFALLIPMVVNRVINAAFSGIGIESGKAKSRIKEIFLEINLLIVVLATCAMTTVALFTEPLILLWIKRPLYGGAVLLAVIVLAELARITRQSFGGQLMGLGLIPDVSKIQMWESPLRILFLVIFVPVFGLLGIAIASLGSLVLTSIPIMRMYQVHAQITLSDLFKILWVPLTVNAVILAGYLCYLPQPENWTQFGIRLCLVSCLQAASLLLLLPDLRRTIFVNLSSIIGLRKPAKQPSPNHQKP